MLKSLRAHRKVEKCHESLTVVDKAPHHLPPPSFSLHCSSQPATPAQLACFQFLECSGLCFTFPLLRISNTLHFYSPFLHSSQLSFWMSLPQTDFPQILRPQVCLRPSARLPHITYYCLAIVTNYFCNNSLTANPSQWLSFLRANSISASFTNTLPLMEYPFGYFHLPLGPKYWKWNSTTVKNILM